MRNMVIVTTLILLIVPPSGEPSHALSVIQFAEVTLKGVPLFTQTGQVIDQQTCSDVAGKNLIDAPSFGYFVAEARAGQALVVKGSGVRNGPDIDTLPPELSYDGCHRSRRGLDISADLWFSTLSSP